MSDEPDNDAAAEPDWEQIATDLSGQLDMARGELRLLRRAAVLTEGVQALAVAVRNISLQASPDQHTIDTIARIERAAGVMADRIVEILSRSET